MVKFVTPLLSMEEHGISMGLRAGLLWSLPAADRPKMSQIGNFTMIGLLINPTVHRKRVFAVAIPCEPVSKMLWQKQMPICFLWDMFSIISYLGQTTSNSD